MDNKKLFELPLFLTFKTLNEVLTSSGDYIINPDNIDINNPDGEYNW